MTDMIVTLLLGRQVALMLLLKILYIIYIAGICHKRLRLR